MNCPGYAFGLLLVCNALYVAPGAASDLAQNSDQESLDAARFAVAEMMRLNKTKGSLCEAKGSVIRYIGSTGKALRNCIQDYPNATTLRITSPGGVVRWAISSARDIAGRKMSVEVLGFCGSSCGNYILPAAAEFSVRPYSAVMLHGAPKVDAGQDSERMFIALKKAGLADEEITEELIAEQLSVIGNERLMHVDFQQEFSVGKNWYELSFYYEAVKRDGGKMLLISEAFSRECLGKATKIGSYWEPNNQAEESALRGLFSGPGWLPEWGPEWGPVWILGRDIDAPVSC